MALALALGGAQLAIQVELMASYVLVAEKILPHRQQTYVIYLNLLTLRLYKFGKDGLVVERFEELNVDVDTNMHMTTMITPRRCFLT